MDIGVLGEEFPDALGLVCGEVVENDVDLSGAGFNGNELAEESDGFLSRVPRCGLIEHRSSASVESGIERQSPMAIILEAMSLSAPGRKWQYWIAAIESLDRSLLIDAENGRVLRRIEVQTDNVRRLPLEVGIVRGHVAFEPMRSKAGALPNPSDHHMVDAKSAGQLAATPVGRAIGRTAPSPLQDLGLEFHSSLLDPAAPVSSKHARQPMLLEAPLPAQDIGRAAPQRLLDCRPRFTVSQHQNQARSAHVAGTKHLGPNTCT